MGSYTVIADTSNTIAEFLKKTLTPEPIKNPELIGICQPNEHGRFNLGICLYDIEENLVGSFYERVKLDTTHYKEPPLSCYLYYMIFVCSESEINTRFIDEQRILGKVLQQMNDFKRIPSQYLMGTLKENNEIIDIQGISITIDEKIKIWSLFNQPYHPSFFYKVGPMFIDMDTVKSSKKKVISAQFDIEQK